MKLVIASDIHGSAHWCAKVVEAFKKEGADRLLLLGDILYHGPRNPLPEEYAPQKVVELLTPLADRIICAATAKAKSTRWFCPSTARPTMPRFLSTG